MDLCFSCLFFVCFSGCVFFSLILGLDSCRYYQTTTTTITKSNRIESDEMQTIQILLCYNDPESHPFITDDEKVYLLIELGGHDQQHGLDPREWHRQRQLQQQQRQRQTSKQTPWRQIFTSVPFIALVLCQVSKQQQYTTGYNNTMNLWKWNRMMGKVTEVWEERRQRSAEVFIQLFICFWSVFTSANECTSFYVTCYFISTFGSRFVELRKYVCVCMWVGGWVTLHNNTLGNEKGCRRV